VTQSEARVLRDPGTDPAAHPAAAVITKINNAVKFESIQVTKLFKEAKMGVSRRVSTKYLTQSM
jgi:hypothetical protein